MTILERYYILNLILNLFLDQNSHYNHHIKKAPTVLEFASVLYRKNVMS